MKVFVQDVLASSAISIPKFPLYPLPPEPPEPPEPPVYELLQVTNPPVPPFTFEKKKFVTPMQALGNYTAPPTGAAAYEGIQDER